MEIPYGYCFCGCGQQTAIITHSILRQGRVKGEPSRFIHGHNGSRKSDDISRFLSHVGKGNSDECWEWTAGRNALGYGNCWFHGRHQMAHRVAWIVANGDIPDGLLSLHKCDNPPCCNPAHLFSGSQADNISDMVNKDRIPRGEQRTEAILTGHEVTEIRQKYVPRVYTVRRLAQEYGVSRGCIWSALKTNWKHI